MNKYKEYLEERLEGMQRLVETSNSIALEEYNNTKQKEVYVIRESFIQYLEAKYGKNVRQEFRDSNKSIEAQTAFIRKYEKDYNEWHEANKYINKICVAEVINMVLVTLGIVNTTTFVILSVILFGGGIGGKLIKEFIKNKKRR